MCPGQGVKNLKIVFKNQAPIVNHRLGEIFRDTPVHRTLECIPKHAFLNGQFISKPIYLLIFNLKLFEVFSISMNR